MNEREYESCGAMRNEFEVERVAYRCRACGVSESRFLNQVSGQVAVGGPDSRIRFQRFFLRRLTNAIS